MASPDPLSEYLRLRDEITERASVLFERYAPHVQCRRGCSSCCDEITVLPIELEPLRTWLLEHGIPRSPQPGDPDSGRGETRRPRCAFLGRGGECTVYDGRPVICRTYGLPLAYRLYEYDMHGREVNPDDPEYADLWCDLNFSEVRGDEDNARSYFDANGRINMDHVQRRIDALNDEFLLTEAGAPYRSRPPGEDRLPLGVLLEPGPVPTGPTPRARRRSGAP